MALEHSLDRKLRALGDPVRRRLLELLATQDHSVGELAEELDLSVATLSHHLSILKEAGLAGMRREGRHHDYFLLSPGLAEASQWLDNLRQRRSRPDWNREAYREQALRDYLDAPELGLPSHPRRREVVLEWFHSLLETGHLLATAEVEARFAQITPRGGEVLEALVEAGRVERREAYILVSD